jgi:RNA polymerase sigma factor (sigma-70 family)
LAAAESLGRASEVEPRPSPGEGAQATSLLYERYSRQIFNFCFHKLGSREEAEDAAQTTFLNAFRGMERGVRPELEQAWLFKIAENVCLTRHRSTFRRRRIESPSDFGVLQEVIPSPPRDADTLIRLSDALSEMTDQQRRALLLREWQGLSYREISEELGLSQAAVETLLFRARRSLASGLTEAPPQKKRGAARLRSGLDFGAILAAAKAAFAGSAAVKVAAVAAVATTTAIAGAKVEKVEHSQAQAKPVAATVTKTHAAQAHVLRAANSSSAAAPVVTHVAPPAKRAAALARVGSGPQAFALVPNRVTEDSGAAVPMPGVPAPAPVAAAAAPAVEQPAAPTVAASAPALVPATTPAERQKAPEQKTRVQKTRAQRAADQQRLDRGLSAATVPPVVAASETDPQPSDTRYASRDHGKLNDRTDRRSKFTDSTPAPAATEAAPVEPAAVEPSDRGNAKWKQNDKRDDRKWNRPAPASVPATAPATTPAAPTTGAAPVAAAPTVTAPMPADNGRKWQDGKQAPAPVAVPTNPAAVPAPAPSEGKANGHDRGWRR